MCDETTENPGARPLPASLDPCEEDSCAESGMLLNLFNGGACFASEWKWLVLAAPLLPSYSRYPGVS